MESQRGQIKHGHVVNKSDVQFCVVNDLKHEDVNLPNAGSRWLRIMSCKCQKRTVF